MTGAARRVRAGATDDNQADGNTTVTALPGWMKELRHGQQLVAELRGRGLRVTLVDGTPRIGPRRLVDEPTIALLAENREPILIALRWERSA